MFVVNARNVHAALPAGLALLETHGERRESRNGPVAVMPCPVTTVYQRPRERVIFWPERDANPFFHLMESLWMLAGRNDVAFPASYVKRMREFSDDGETFHGAYGHRWINHFARVVEGSTSDDVEVVTIDQVRTIIQLLKLNPNDRRAVLGMWDPSVDLGRQGKDVPCNTQAYFSVASSGHLDMTVCNRSNDVVWGAYGANAVHFSILQEFVANALGVPVGRYWQMSNNYHAYLDTLKGVANLACMHHSTSCPYQDGTVGPYKLMNTPIDSWLQDLHIFLDEGPVLGLRDPFFRKVAVPMALAHAAFKGETGAAKYSVPLNILRNCTATDWRLAAEEWIIRRRDRKANG